MPSPFHFEDQAGIKPPKAKSESQTKSRVARLRFRFRQRQRKLRKRLAKAIDWRDLTRTQRQHERNRLDRPGCAQGVAEISFRGEYSWLVLSGKKIAESV